jgi:hypothetical protein
MMSMHIRQMILPLAFILSNMWGCKSKESVLEFKEDPRYLLSFKNVLKDFNCMPAYDDFDRTTISVYVTSKITETGSITRSLCFDFGGCSDSLSGSDKIPWIKVPEKSKVKRKKGTYIIMHRILSKNNLDYLSVRVFDQDFDISGEYLFVFDLDGNFMGCERGMGIY